MKKWITRNLKWLIAASAVLVIAAAVPTTSEAGRRWSGADPVFKVNGHDLNIWVQWETEHTCDIKGPINVVVAMPHDAKYEFIEESNEKFDCDGDGRADTRITTNTVVREYRGDKVVVGALFNAPDIRFQTGLEVQKDGKTATKCKGVANTFFLCRGVRF